MTVEERMAIIKNKAEQSKNEAQIKADAEERERFELMEQIKDLINRIEDLCKLANACLENGIEIPCNKQFSFDYNSGEKWGYPYEFIAEEIRHHVGFFTPKFEWNNNGKKTFTEPFRYIGIKNGGACGVWDFRTDGVAVESINNTDYDKGKMAEPRIRDMKQFLKEFPLFEQGFLNWIDSLQ